jgi:hypothetical protein
MPIGKISSALIAGAPMPAQKAACSKRLSASTYEPWLEQPNYPPGALTYIKGDRRIDLDLLAFLATAPVEAGDSLAF